MLETSLPEGRLFVLFCFYPIIAPRGMINVLVLEISPSDFLLYKGFEFIRNKAGQRELKLFPYMLGLPKPEGGLSPYTHAPVVGLGIVAQSAVSGVLQTGQ